MTKIEHREAGQTAFLEMVYVYDERGLITSITETDENSIVSTVTFDYDGNWVIRDSHLLNAGRMTKIEHRK